MLQTSLVLILSLLLSAADVVAQEGTVLNPGKRVRVSAPELDLRKQVATIVSVDADTLTVEINGWVAPVAIPTASVTRLEVRRRRSGSRVWKGAGLGFLAGAVVGGVSGYLLAHEGSTNSNGDYGPLGAVAGGVLGGGVGALIGALVAVGDRWESVPLPIRVGTAPRRDGEEAVTASLVL